MSKESEAAKAIVEDIYNYIFTAMKKDVEEKYPGKSSKEIFDEDDYKWCLDEVEDRINTSPKMIMYAFWPFFDRTAIFVNDNDTPYVPAEHQKAMLEIIRRRFND